MTDWSRRRQSLSPEFAVGYQQNMTTRLRQSGGQSDGIARGYKHMKGTGGQPQTRAHSASRGSANGGPIRMGYKHYMLPMGSQTQQLSASAGRVSQTTGSSYRPSSAVSEEALEAYRRQILSIRLPQQPRGSQFVRRSGGLNRISRSGSGLVSNRVSSRASSYGSRRGSGLISRQSASQASNQLPRYASGSRFVRRSSPLNPIAGSDSGFVSNRTSSQALSRVLGLSSRRGSRRVPSSGKSFKNQILDRFEGKMRVVSTQGTDEDVAIEGTDGSLGGGLHSRQLSSRRQSSQSGGTQWTGRRRSGPSFKERLIRQIAPNFQIVAEEGTDDDISIEGPDDGERSQGSGRSSGSQQMRGYRKSGKSFKDQILNRFEGKMRVVSTKGTDDDVDIEGPDERHAIHQSRQFSSRRQSSQSGDSRRRSVPSFKERLLQQIAPHLQIIGSDGTDNDISIEGPEDSVDYHQPRPVSPQRQHHMIDRGIQTQSMRASQRRLYRGPTTGARLLPSYSGSGQRFQQRSPARFTGHRVATGVRHYPSASPSIRLSRHRQSGGLNRVSSRPSSLASSQGSRSMSSSGSRRTGSGQRVVSFKERLIRQIAPNFQIVAEEGTDDDISIEGLDDGEGSQGSGRSSGSQRMRGHRKSGKSFKDGILNRFEGKMRVVSTKGTDDDVDIEGPDERHAIHQSRQFSSRRQSSQSGGTQWTGRRRSSPSFKERLLQQIAPHLQIIGSDGTDNDISIEGPEDSVHYYQPRRGVRTQSLSGSQRQLYRGQTTGARFTPSYTVSGQRFQQRSPARYTGHRVTTSLLHYPSASPSVGQSIHRRSGGLNRVSSQALSPGSRSMSFTGSRRAESGQRVMSIKEQLLQQIAPQFKIVSEEGNDDDISIEPISRGSDRSSGSPRMRGHRKSGKSFKDQILNRFEGKMKVVSTRGTDDDVDIEGADERLGGGLQSRQLSSRRQSSQSQRSLYRGQTTGARFTPSYTVSGQRFQQRSPARYTGHRVTTSLPHYPSASTSVGQSRHRFSSRGSRSMSSTGSRRTESGQRVVSLKEQLLRQIAPNFQIVSEEGNDDDISIEGPDEGVAYHESRRVSPQRQGSQKLIKGHKHHLLAMGVHMKTIPNA